MQIKKKSPKLFFIETIVEKNKRKTFVVVDL